MLDRIRTPIVITAFLATASSAPAAGDELSYYIGQQVAVMKVATTTSRTRAIKELTGNSRKQCEFRHAAVERELCVVSTTTTTREGTAALQFVPDRGLAVNVSTSSPGLVDEQQTLQLTDGMLLKGINISSTGRAGEVVTSIAKFIGTVMGGAAFLAAPLAPGEARGISTCDPFASAFKDLPDTARLFLWEHQARCDDWQAITRLAETRDARLKDKLELEGEIRSADRIKLPLLLKKIDELNAALTRLDKELKARREAFDKALAVYAESLRLGTTSETANYGQVAGLDVLPPSTGLEPGLEESAVQTGNLSSQALTLWTEARMIVAVDDNLTCSTRPTVPVNPEPKKEVQIAFRQGTPVRIRVFILDQRPDPQDPQSLPSSRLRVVADQWQNVVHPCLPISTMQFSRSAWAKRDLSITFDDSGRPVRIERGSGSNIAAIAASVASAAASVRDEYASTLGKATQIAADRRTLQLDELTTRLERLKKEKDVFDAQVRLDSAGATREATLRQQQAAADMAQLQAELALQTAQASAEQKLQIDQLKTAVEQIKQQIDLLQTQQQLEKLKKGGGE